MMHMDDMRSLFYESLTFLTSLLDQELDLYKEMEQVLREEKEALIHCRHDKITKNNLTKADILYRIENLERSRQEMTRKLAGSLNLDKTPAEMLSLLCRVQGAPAECLQRYRKEIKDILQRVYAMNTENRRLAENAFNYTRNWLSYIHRLLAPQVDYQNHWHNNTMALNGQVVDRKG